MTTNPGRTTRAYGDAHVNLARLNSRTVAVIGYGNQGRAHALNLRDSGVNTVTGLHASSSSTELAVDDGTRVLSVADATRVADIVMMLTPDVGQGGIYREQVAPHLRDGQTLMFAHGFNIRFGEIVPRAGIDVSLVAPKGVGKRVRELFVHGAGVPALVAVHQDASGNALADALAYAKAIGCTRAGVFETTFAAETEADLFSEQAVLCGGVSALIKAGFETLVEAGYQPEVAYFECLHELKLITDLIYEGGLTHMRSCISDTAEYGDYVAGSRLVTDETRSAMRQLLSEVRDGTFARAWIEENRRGRRTFMAMREEQALHAIEQVGRDLRHAMPFLTKH